MLTLLTLLRGSSGALDALKSASILQQALGAELLVAHPHEEGDMPAIVMDASFAPIIDRGEPGNPSAHAREIFDTVCAGRPDCRFRAINMSPADTLRKQSLFADMLVLARDQGFVDTAFSLLKSALVSYRTPTVFLPTQCLSTTPETVIVSWNGSAPAARAIRAALPLIKRARRLIVLEHAGCDVNRSRLDYFLDINGIRPADWRNYGDESLTARGRARALLAEAGDEGCDLLVMGAYGEAGESFFRFGRATEKVASAAKIPVLFSS